MTPEYLEKNARFQFCKDWFLIEPPKANDVIMGEGSVIPCHNGLYFYEVSEVESLPRFGSPNFLLKVKKYAVSENFGEIRFVEKTSLWANQLF